jgi:hypothetical protein
MNAHRAAMRHLTKPTSKKPADQDFDEYGHPWLPSLFNVGLENTLDVNSKLYPNRAILGVGINAYATAKELAYLDSKVVGEGYCCLPYYRNTHGVRKVLNRIIERARWRRVDNYKRYSKFKTKREIAHAAFHAKHGDEIICPACNSRGQADKHPKLAVDRSLNNPIWFNSALGEWECTECWLK